MGQMIDSKRTVQPGAQAKPAPLQNFDAPTSASSHFDLIQDVPLEIAVVVGRTRKMMREIIDIASGSIIELDKQAGEPLDIVVNGQLIARGQVVVIEENFGVRITEIIDKKGGRDVG